MTYEEGREATRKLLALSCPPEAILAMMIRWLLLR